MKSYQPNLNPKICLVYDRINTAYGGAEKVLLALHQCFPKAPLFTAIYDPQIACWSKKFQVKASFINTFTPIRIFFRFFAWIMPLAFESLNLNNFDLIISITSGEAKGVITKPHQLHLCYLLTPPRYLYSHQQKIWQEKKWLNWWPINLLSQWLINYLTWWDQISIYRPDYLIPISQAIANRVKKYYHQKTLPVIYPPTETQTIVNVKTNNNYLIVVSRLVVGKNLGLAIKVCALLKQNLIIIGQGPEQKRLQKQINLLHANQYIQILNNVTAASLTRYYQYCQALLLPGEEDFGIVALEANSFGKPCIINKNAGAAEVIINGIHGLHFDGNNPNDLITQISKLRKLKFSSSLLIQNAKKYDTNMFVQKFSKTTYQLWKKFQLTRRKGTQEYD